MDQSGGSAALRFAMSNLIGKVVQVQTTTGAVYEGIFHTADLTPGPEAISVVLKKAYKKDAESKTPTSPFSNTLEKASKDLVIHDLMIKGSSVAQISAVGLDLGFKAPPPDGLDGFTDTGISGGHGQIHERKLEAWTPDDGDTFDMSLEAPSSRGGKKGGSFWSPEEMFATNAREHNYETAWDEDEYTTKIDKSAPGYQAKMAKAKRIAEEINRGEGVVKSDNPHLLHDRGVEIELDGNEEALFGSVARNENPNAYKPPHMRSNSNESGSKRPAKPNKTDGAQSKAESSPSKPPGLTKPPDRKSVV